MFRLVSALLCSSIDPRHSLNKSALNAPLPESRYGKWAGNLYFSRELCSRNTLIGPTILHANPKPNPSTIPSRYTTRKTPDLYFALPALLLFAAPTLKGNTVFSAYYNNGTAGSSGDKSATVYGWEAAIDTAGTVVSSVVSSAGADLSRCQ